MPLVIFACFVFVVIGVIIWAVRNEKKRTAAIKALAERLGFFFQENPQSELHQPYKHLKLFSRGRSQKTHNLLRKDAGGRTIYLFDYRYVTGSGKQRSTHNQSVLMLKDQSINLPQFTLQPETVFHRLGKAFVGEDIDFDEHEVFSKKYYLKSEVEPEVRELFAGDLARFFESNLGWSVESDQGVLLVYRYGKRPGTDKYEAFVTSALGIVQQLHG